MNDLNLKHVAILEIDLEGYSKFSKSERRTMMTRLQEILNSAAEKFTFSFDTTQNRQGTGDGYYLPLKGLAAFEALDFALNINTDLNEYNAKHSADLPIRLRMVLDIGDVELIGDQYSSDEYINEERFINYSPFKKYLAETGESTVLAISRLFHTELVDDQTQVNKSKQESELIWTPFSFKDKHNFEHTGYVLGAGWQKNATEDIQGNEEQSNLLNTDFRVNESI